MAIVFMVRGFAPRHRFNTDGRFGWTLMRYGFRLAMAALSMPPLPARVVPTAQLGLSVALPGRTTALPAALLGAA